MTKENDNNAQPSSFRDQILRELEELKAQRLEGQPEETLSQVNDKVVEEIEAIASVAKNEIDHSEVAEFEPEELPKVLEESADESISEEITVFDEKQTDSNVGDQPQPVLQDTVERNLEELRNFISANPELLGDQLLESEKMGSTSVQSEESFDAHSTSPSLEDTFIDFPKEDVSTVTGDTEIIPLEATLIAPSVAVSKEPIKVEESQPRRRTHSKNKQKRKKQDRTAKRIVAVVMSLVVVFFLATCTFGFFWVKSSLEPVNTEATKTIQVEIPEGSSTKEIANILFENDLIKNATVFNYYSKIKSYNNYQSGFYNLSQSMSVDDLAKALQESGTPTAQEEPAGKVLIVEGYTLIQIANSVTLNAKTDDKTDKTDKTPFTSEEFLTTVTNQEFIDRMVATYPNLFASLPAADSGAIYRLEGYLFPAVYDYYDDTTIEDLVEQMISTTDARLQPYYEAIANKNLTVNEVLTLASLVEKEGSTDEDRRNIASVFFNRLNAEMPLQSNIAILYAQGKLGEETTLAEDTNIDTSIESPYNIYWRTGLMPGPVDSPSLAAIDAVINANTTDYLYFVADVTTGTVYFAKTIEEHDQNVANYVNAHLE